MTDFLAVMETYRDANLSPPGLVTGALSLPCSKPECFDWLLQPVGLWWR